MCEQEFLPENEDLAGITCWKQQDDGTEVEIKFEDMRAGDRIRFVVVDGIRPDHADVLMSDPVRVLIGDGPKWTWFVMIEVR